MTGDGQQSGGTHRTFGEVTAEEAGARLDAWLAGTSDDLSRERWKDLIKSGHVTVNGTVRKPNYGMAAGDVVEAVIPPPQELELTAEDIPLEILFEDEAMIVINKPPRLVVHPAPGHDSGTLVNALLHHCEDLGGIGGEIRPGIVHRLDQDTSGVLVVAKHDESMLRLSAQFKDRTTGKEYRALVWGTPAPAEGNVETTIGRDPRNRQKMSTRAPGGRRAVSHYRLIETLGPLAHLSVTIETGRTHQIRVHMQHIGHPIAGDPVYGRRKPPALPVPLPRQMLHAHRLTIAHPLTGERMTFTAPLPDDMTTVIEACRHLS